MTDTADTSRCDAECYLGDDHGDNTCTIHCHREKGHGGPHREVTRDGALRIEFDVDAKCRAFVRPVWEWDDTAWDGYFDMCANCSKTTEDHR